MPYMSSGIMCLIQNKQITAICALYICYMCLIPFLIYVPYNVPNRTVKAAKTGRQKGYIAGKEGNMDINKLTAKFMEALKEAKEEVKTGTVTKVSISNKNSKMGEVPSVSILPILTCPGRCKGTCGKDCYAAKLANLRPSVLKSYARNTALLMLRPDLYWQGVNYAMAGVRYFRYHVSGDILDKKYFGKMVDSAIKNPHCEILAFTKRYEIVNAWIKENGSLPKNLHILFSGWENLKPVNPYKLPETNVFGKEGPKEEWKVCGGNCFNCACRGLGCWKAEPGDVVAFKKH